MKEYTKIETLWNRDEKTFKVKVGEYRLPEFEYLKDNIWIFTEKIDGTNIRVMYQGGNILKFGGRTDDAQMPVFLLRKLEELFTLEKMQLVFPDVDEVCLYGEGFGAKIQKGGGNYNPNGVDFILFDIKIGEWWLRRADVEDIAQTLGIKVVPIITEGTIAIATDMARSGYLSTFGNFLAEGIVLRPKVDLVARNGQRIIAKIKHKDF